MLLERFQTFCSASAVPNPSWAVSVLQCLGIIHLREDSGSGFLRRQLRELIHVGLARGQQGGDEPSSFLRQQPAVRAADSFDQPVRPQQSQLPRHPPGLPPLLGCTVCLGYRCPRRSRFRKPASAYSPRLTTSSNAPSAALHGLSARWRWPSTVTDWQTFTASWHNGVLSRTLASAPRYRRWPRG